MKSLRSAISLICKNTRNELHLLRQNRSFCTAKSGNNETKLDGKSISITERNNDQVANDESNLVNNEESNLCDVKSGILITSYSTVSSIL